MPVYEYACMECEEHFEELVRMDGDDPACPSCGAGDVLRQLSTFAVSGGAAESGWEAPRPPRAGGCCGGSCGCG